ncbi:hypothetical protein BDC45DRAFT_546567 [Circinella umbellata]|nr:hypothetical protein BDC45DRAFT_546567 [Circinella umbellata]
MPTRGPVDQPHRPKLRKIQIGELEQLFHFGTEYCHMDDVCKEDYRVYQQEQSQNSSLCHLDLLNKLTHLLEKVHYDAFLDEIWSMKPNENMSDQGKVCLAISKHVLSSFHLAHHSTPMFMLDCEHISFCENIVPSLLALLKMTGFLEFRWCEAPFNATKSNYLKEGNYDGRSIQAAKNIDALGLLKTQSNMELVIVEASSGILKEHTTHTIEDSLKILECSVASLRREAANYKFSSLETFKKLNTYSIQIIKSKITLSKTSLYNKNT